MVGSEQKSITRRDAFKGAAAGAAAVGFGVMSSKETVAQEAYDAIVIGTGFGGTIATLALSAHGKKTLVIERGTFWVTPETLGAPTAPGNAVANWAKSKNLRVQYWSRPDHALGLLDLLANRYHEENPYGLHNYRMFPHAHILTASGVGGGSLIYSNVNLRARPAVLDRFAAIFLHVALGADLHRLSKLSEQRWNSEWDASDEAIQHRSCIAADYLGHRLSLWTAYVFGR
jgi:choline dehydrogenase-like flavoprotein